MLLNGLVEEILAADGDGHRAVDRVHAESAIDERVRVGQSLIAGKDILPERAVDEAAPEVAETAPARHAHASVEPVSRRQVEL